MKTVLDKWAKDFTTLYKGFPENSPNYDKNFLIQAKAISTKAPSGDEPNNQILNNIFTEHEVKKHTSAAKCGKAVSVDEIPNETLKNDNFLMQQYENTWINQIILKPKLELYRQYKNTPSQESYCKVSLKRGQRSVLAKIRLGVFPINLELGRYSGIPREERWCAICTRQEIENEFHVFFQCPNYDSQREVLFCQATNILNIFNDLNDLEKFAFLVSNENIVRKTGTLLNNILQIRQSVLRS